MMRKIDPNLLNSVMALSDFSDEEECIVYANNYNLTKRYLKGILNNTDFIEYPFIYAFGVKVNNKNLHKIASFNEVSYITSNFKVKTLVDVSKKVLKLKEVGSKSYNHNFSVAVIDTGIEPILDLTFPKNRIIESVDFVDGLDGPYDDNGHGTFIAGMVAGNGMASGGKYKGIDTNANLISLKALDKNGETGAITILKAMQWVYDNRKKYNIRVVCMSFGSSTIGKKDPLIIGAEVLWNAGIVVVCAAGNSGPEDESIKSPGASSKIITVGALDDHRDSDGAFNSAKFTVADFSSRGPVLGNYKPDLIAPGVKITGPSNYKHSGKHYTQMNGTSVATPMVAGVCSLLIAKNKSLTPNDIKKILIQNCTPITNNRNYEGFGLLNCEKIIAEN